MSVHVLRPFSRRRPRRPGAAKRLSVWHFLVAIALLPMLGLPGLAATIVQVRLSDAAAASRVEHELQAIVAVDQLRAAMNIEAGAGPIARAARQLGAPVSFISDQLGWHITSLAAARSTTDSVLRAVPRTTLLATMTSRIAADLPSVRAAADAAIAAPGANLAPLNSVDTAYERLAALATDAEQALAHRVGNGTDGLISTRLLQSARAIEITCAVTVSQSRRISIFFLSLTGGSSTRANLEALGWETRRYEVLSDQLGSELTQAAARTWRRLADDPQFRLFDAAVAKVLSPSASTSSLNGLTQATSQQTVAPTSRAAGHILSTLSAFNQDAARDGAAIAAADAARARGRAVTALVGTGGVVLLTTVLLFTVGGALRRRLDRLAQGAQRISAGQLEPVPIHGPRELAAAGDAINMAVASLRQIQTKAELIAAGDLRAPELETLTPGPLGAAVDASVSRLITAVREREELQLLLVHRASHDALTGLPNRAELYRTLETALDRAERNGTAVGVLFVDLDGFKACNDRFGHAAGDHVLRVATSRLTEAISETDIVARLGGDEFVVVVPALSSAPRAIQIGERIVSTLSEPFWYQGEQVNIGASVGLAICERGMKTADELLAEADTAVYHAKAAGRGRVSVHHYDPS